MTSIVLKVKVNGVEKELVGKQAEQVNSYALRKIQAGKVKEQQKEANKLVKQSEQAFYDLLTDNQLRLNDTNDIEIIDSTGMQIIDTFSLTNKDLEAPKLMDKKAIISFIAEGINNGFIAIDSEQALTWLEQNQFEPNVDLNEFDEYMTNIQFNNLLKKTRTKIKHKEKLTINN